MAYDNVKVKARQVVSQTQQTKELGIVSPVPMGDWIATTQYLKLNIVRYNGTTYMATADNKGVVPDSNNSFWRLQSKDGRGVQNTTITYQAGESGTIPPNGVWTSNVPVVPQGQYLWTRIVYNFTDGTQTISWSVSLQGLNFTQQDRDDIDRIGAAIPSTAGADNPVATEAFVNSSVNNSAAFYITYTQGSETQFGQAFPTAASLLNATTFYSGKDVRIPTQNDYATVLADETRPKGADGSYPTTRYSYQGGTYPNGQWAFQYVVNNTSLTQAQVDAINSGITSSLVNKLNGIEAGAQKNLPVDTAMSATSTNAVQNKVIKAYIDDTVASAISTLLNTPV